ncbi:hypothetical protein BGZ95_003372 [Linnemannia exigua]|uniref:Uncharacterized protein n=1 Tax=Linnemannia exigua TaxID=604196 RepID=A0AAD4DIB6_9FUNG|nr:hypothetical protein BGZ95_003372 [Linnemannia exigua]
MNNNSQTSKSATSWTPSVQENRPDRVHSHNTAHSTHSYCETFDQATRDIQQESKSASGAVGGETMSTGSHHGGRAKENNQIDESEQALREANSAVQLDRDMKQSRRGSDDVKQSGSIGRDGSWSTNPHELPYIE